MLTPVLTLAFAFMISADSPAQQAPPPKSPGSCKTERFQNADYIVCRFARGDKGLRLYLNDETGAPYGHFSTLKKALKSEGETLTFAMNAGMYHQDRSPVGLYIEQGRQRSPLQTGRGYGNFHLLPNGVFYIDASGAHIAETLSYAKRAPAADYATQSGPMLVINGALHLRFIVNSTSLKRRNGVGINSTTDEVIFAISEAPVSFHAFASLFRDQLGTKDALYLDGTISRLYAPELSRNDPGIAMGPILAHVVTD